MKLGDESASCMKISPREVNRIKAARRISLNTCQGYIVLRRRKRGGWVRWSRFIDFTHIGKAVFSKFFPVVRLHAAQCASDTYVPIE